MSGFTRRPRRLRQQQQPYQQQWQQPYGPQGYGPQGYGDSYPPRFPGSPPPRRDEHHGGRVMLWLTLIGTVATVISVLVGMGIGPFDVTGRNDDRPSSPAKPTLEAWAAKVNEHCARESSEVTTRLQAKDAALAANDLNAYATEMNALSRRLDGLVGQIKGVPLPQDPRAREWRDVYEERSKHVQTAAGKAQEGATLLADGDQDAAMAAFTESDQAVDRADEIGKRESDLSGAIGTSCP